MTSSWLDDLNARPVVDVAQSLAYRVVNGQIGPCPACKAEHRSKSDKRPPIGTISSGLGWECHACKIKGSTVSFAALHYVGEIPGKGSPRWRDLQAQVIAAGLVVDTAPRSQEPAPPPKRLTSAEVLDVWNRCLRVDTLDEEDAASGFLSGRAFGPPSALAALDVVRVMPVGMATPWWWPAGWSHTWRLVTLAYEADGTVASMHARAVVDTDAGKTRWPKAQRIKDGPREAEARELLFASPVAVRLLRGEIFESLTLIVGEGLTSLVNASLLLRDRANVAVITATSGGFTALRNVKWPAKCVVYVATDDKDKDGTGEKYAREVLASLPAHVGCKRIRWNAGGGDGDRDLGNATLESLRAAREAAVDMRGQSSQQAENGPAANPAVEDLRQLLAKLQVAQDETELRGALAAWQMAGGIDAIRKVYRDERDAIDALFTQILGIKALKKDFSDILKRIRARNAPQRTSERAVVDIELDMVAMTKRGLALLADHPNVYMQHGRIVQVGRSELGTTLRDANENAVRYALAEAATWQVTPKEGEPREELPPDWLAKAIVVQPSLPFRPITAITRCPTLRPDGSLLAERGYDVATKLFVDLPEGLEVDVPDEPTIDDADAAVEVLLDIVHDFPFEATHHRSAWLAALLTLVARPAIDGCCPLFLFTASTPGSGKGLLADLIALIALGDDLPKQSFSKNDDEFRKRITAIALSGVPMVMIDNVNVELAGSALDSAITSRVWTDRELGISKMVTAPLRVMWMASGNNMSLGGDMIRRVQVIHLMPDCEHPEQRTGFRHPRLVEHVRAHRAQLLSACLTLLRAFVHQGRPRQRPALGSFEDWSSLVRDAIVWVGQADPCDGITQLRRDGDPKLAAASALLSAWQNHFRDGSATAGDVARILTNYIPSNQQTMVGSDTLGGLYAALRDEPRAWGRDNRLDTRTLGTWLRSWKDRVVDGRKFVSDGAAHKVTLWRVVSVTGTSGDVRGVSGDVWQETPPDDEPRL